jgi:signal transduction histidine kinase
MPVKTPRVLLVDDEPRNLRLLERMLSPLGYELRAASDGQTALRLAVEGPPDLVLLDVMMPGLTGIDVCRLLRMEPAVGFVPIVLLTSLSDGESRVAGLDAGADDFVSRPVEATELRARVKALLRTKALYDELQERYRELQVLEASRNGLAQMIVHDLRNPLVSVIGYLELIECGYVSGEAAQQSVRVVKRNAERVVAMVTDILNVSKLEAGRLSLEKAAVDLASLAADVALDAKPLLEQKRLELAVAIPPDLPPASADRELVRRVLVNLVSNAASFSPQGSTVSLSAEKGEGQLRVQITDSGPGVPVEDRDRIFEKFGALNGRKSGRKYSTGLGLAFCKLTVEAHGGRIGIDGNSGPGSTFWFTLGQAAQEKVS